LHPKPSTRSPETRSPELQTRRGAAHTGDLAREARSDARKEFGDFDTVAGAAPVASNQDRGRANARGTPSASSAPRPARHKPSTVPAPMPANSKPSQEARTGADGAREPRSYNMKGLQTTSFNSKTMHPEP